MRNSILIGLLVFYITFLYSNTILIDINGNGDYTSIQEAIDISSDFDSLIVYPGIYYENLEIIQKSITLASTYIYTTADSTIQSTIIDGSNNGRCMLISGCDQMHLIGFTIQNGNTGMDFSQSSGGGGIKNSDSSTTIESCRIINNYSFSCGGIYNNSSNLHLKGNTIAYNYATFSGGGFHSNQCLGKIVNFDPIDLNNVYLNYSADGADITFSLFHENTIVCIDTFTVLIPTPFFSSLPDQIELEVQNAKIVEIEHDLYVSPNGSDLNSGLSFNDPLQTIAWAQTLIKSDSTNYYSIYLEDGEYSPSLNNQKFPMNTKQYTKIEGESRENTILNAEDLSNLVHSSTKYNKKYFHYKNVTLRNGASPYIIFSSCINLNVTISDLLLENCIISSCHGDSRVVHLAEGSHKFINCVFSNNVGNKILWAGPELLEETPVIELKLIDCAFDENDPYYDPDGFSDGGAIHFSGHYTGIGSYNAEIINTQFSNNHNRLCSNGTGGTAGIYIERYANVDIVNCTLGNNTIQYPNGNCLSVNYNTNLSIYNTIIYDNDGYTVTVRDNNSVVNIYNSLLEGGEDNIYLMENGTVNWFGENLFSDPFWLGTIADYYYALSDDSPCIDTGTLDLPVGIELPEYDLAGNPRIYGDMIDMGAYEWQGVASENFKLTNSKSTIWNYPNPFNPETIIFFDIQISSHLELNIYNMKGQKIKHLVDDFFEFGSYSAKWNGTDDLGNLVSSGIYFYQLKHNDFILTGKCLFLK